MKVGRVTVTYTVDETLKLAVYVEPDDEKLGLFVRNIIDEIRTGQTMMQYDENGKPVPPPMINVLVQYVDEEPGSNGKRVKREVSIPHDTPYDEAMRETDGLIIEANETLKQCGYDALEDDEENGDDG